MRNTIEDKEKLADKIDADDKTKINDALVEAQDWLNSNDDAEKDDFEEHFKELQRICDPIIGKVYKSAGGQGQGGSGYDDEEFEDL
jgi:heat shock protein 5